MRGEKPKGPSRTSMWSNLHSQEGSMEYLSSKNKSMHCRGEAGGGWMRKSGWGSSTVVKEWNRKNEEKDESRTFYNVDTLPFRWVFLRVVRWGEIPSFRLLYPCSTLPSRCHTWVVLYWKAGSVDQSVKLNSSWRQFDLACSSIPKL